MTNSPLKSYGFVYPYNGKEYALDITAYSADEAKGRVRAMAEASFFGELHESTANEKAIKLVAKDEKANTSISRRAVGSTDSETTEPAARGTDVKTKPCWLGRLDALLGSCLLFTYSCSNIKADPNKVDPTLFKIFGNIVIIFTCVALIGIGIIFIAMLKEEFPSLFNYRRWFFRR